jgi:hypothetical protein
METNQEETSDNGINSSLNTQIDNQINQTSQS